MDGHVASLLAMTRPVHSLHHASLAWFPLLAMTGRETVYDDFHEAVGGEAQDDGIKKGGPKSASLTAFERPDF
jgi:hypothetical protein